MPHECTECGRAFEDGSKEMLSGCPNCGGTTFQFRPEGVDAPADATDPPDPPEPDVDGVARTVGNAASAVRNLVTRGDRSPGPTDGDPDDSRSDAGSPAVTGESALETAGSGEGAGPAVSAEDPASDQSDADTPSSESGHPAGSPGETAGDPGTDDGQHVTTTRREGGAQSDARSDIVEADELPDAPDRPRDRPPVPDPRPLSARPDADASGDDDSPDAVDAAEPDTDASGDDDSPDAVDAVEPDTDAETGSDPEAGAADAGDEVSDDPDERPSLAELREELNDQFESIRVVAPGQYELNLMELYDREEYIIALQEDGKYTIQLPERWEER